MIMKTAGWKRSDEVACSVGAVLRAWGEAGNPTPLTLGALAYLILFIPFVVFGRWIETRYSWKR